MIGPQKQHVCTDPEADMFIKQLWGKHVDIVEKHLQKTKHTKKKISEDKKKQKKNQTFKANNQVQIGSFGCIALKTNYANQ